MTKTVFRLLVVAGCVASLAACAPNQATTTVQPFVATVSADVGKAEQVYAIIKGEAQVAKLADPSLAPLVDKSIATLDPYAAALASGTPVLGGIVVSAAGLVDQAAALEAATAQAIKVVPGT